MRWKNAQDDQQASENWDYMLILNTHNRVTSTNVYKTGQAACTLFVSVNHVLQTLERPKGLKRQGNHMAV